jgi:mRNA-degrading endonuclease RelE of RelBE toxin-antitoxin system
VTCQVFLSARAQQDLDAFSDKIARQILADCTRLARDPIPDGKRIKKLQGFKESLYRLRAGDYRVGFKRSGSRIDIVRVPAAHSAKSVVRY